MLDTVASETAPVRLENTLVIAAVVGYVRRPDPRDGGTPDDGYALLCPATRMELPGRTQEARTAHAEIVARYGKTPAGTDAQKCWENPRRRHGLTG